MSALWHDTDYLPDKSIHVPSVQKHLDEAPLPSEEHQLPKGWDAFNKMDEVYEVAGAQMDRGIDAQAFLYGKKPPASVNDAVAAQREVSAPDELTQTMVAQRHRVGEADNTYNPLAVQEARQADEQLIKREEAGTQPSKVSNATEGANARQDSARSVKALEMAEGIGVMMAAVAAGQAIDPASGSIAAEAAGVVKAVSTAKSAIGMTRPMQDTPETSRSEFLRRGIQARSAFEHQPSIEPEPDFGHQPSLDPGDRNKD